MHPLHNPSPTQNCTQGAWLNAWMTSQFLLPPFNYRVVSLCTGFGEDLKWCLSPFRRLPVELDSRTSCLWIHEYLALVFDEITRKKGGQFAIFSWPVTMVCCRFQWVHWVFFKGRWKIVVVDAFVLLLFFRIIMVLYSFSRFWEVLVLLVGKPHMYLVILVLMFGHNGWITCYAAMKMVA